ncbi:hypothetical protein Tco_1248050, partial [Tanacetum coccineum]
MENSKKGNLPLHHGIKISKDLCLKTYALVVGSITYAMVCTRPDVSFALSMVSQHEQNPGEVAEWGSGDMDSSKQDIVADSTCKFEYIRACEASKEA